MLKGYNFNLANCDSCGLLANTKFGIISLVLSGGEISFATHD